MSANSKIEWCHHTFNPWWGCEKVSPACAFCYAERDSKRYGFKLWGEGSDRRFFGEKHWNEPLTWNSKALLAGRRERVFCASMADVFEDREDLIAPRAELFRLIECTSQLDWLLLTKRPENIAAHIGRYLPLLARAGDDATFAANLWLSQHRNVWLGTTAEDQSNFDRRWPIISQLRPSTIFISAEPLLGPIQLPEDFLLPDYAQDDPRHVRRWMIVGGESGPHARAMHPDWARRLRDDCELEDIPFFFKQWGEWREAHTGDAIDSLPILRLNARNYYCQEDNLEVPMIRVGKKSAGRLLDGREWNEFPKDVAR